MILKSLLVILGLLSASGPVPQTPARGSNSGGGGAFDENATSLAGDYLARGADLTGASDGKMGTVSFWAKMGTGTDNNNAYIYASAGHVMTIIKLSSNVLRIQIADTGGTTRVRLATLATINEALGWFHIMASWDVTAPGAHHVYVNGSSSEDALIFITDGSDPELLEYTRANHWIGSDETPGANLHGGCLSEVYINLAEYVDLSVQANREKFRTAGGQPENLGATGATPTGTQPIIYLPNAFGTFQNNAGGGGNFTVTGTLSACADEP
jgi:hypothetical protein